MMMMMTVLRMIYELDMMRVAASEEASLTNVGRDRRAFAAVRVLPGKKMSGIRYS